MKYLTEDPRWVHFYPRFSTSFVLEKAGYFDERPEVSTSITQLLGLIALPIVLLHSWSGLLLIPFIFLGWGRLYIHLPVKTGIQECDSARWGINIHDHAIFVYTGSGNIFGSSLKSVYLPWALQWVRTSTLLNDNTWYNEVPGKVRTYDDSKNDKGTHNWIEENRWKETHDYIDSYDNSVVQATIGVREHEWRPKWFKWTSLFAKKRRSITVDFSDEVGENKGSWKGGTLGCSYDLLPNETPYQCLKRMEKERIF